MTFLIAITLNLAGMLLIYSLLAFALVRLKWHGHGVIPVLVPIIVAGQFWIIPIMLVRNLAGGEVVAYSLAFCDWLISGFSIIILCQAVRWIPRELEDSARLDGCDWFGTYWHVVLPLVRRELALIVFLTLTGTLALCLVPLTLFDLPRLIDLLASRPTWSENGIGLPQTIGLMMGASLLATLPLIVVFVFAKRYLQQRRV
jgi:multiple sugar transport system permease protein